MTLPHPPLPSLQPVEYPGPSSPPCERQISDPNTENAAFSPIHSHYYCYWFFDQLEES